MTPTTKRAASASTAAARAAEGASIVGIYTAPKSGAPMEQQGSVVVVPGEGIVGDRYALHTGTWSNPKWPDQELTLFASEVAEAIGIEAYQARRNLVTRGIELSGLVGVRFRIGEALIAGVRACDPCRYIQQLNAQPGLTKALAGYNGGLRARVIEGGKVRLGDTIEIVGLDE
jgi:MOSC domain-containing protein YiiM